MMPGAPRTTQPQCYIFPGDYKEQILISSNKNNGLMLISNLSNSLPYVDGLALSNAGFRITNAANIKLRGLNIKAYTNSGIQLLNLTTNITIISNSIYSNLRAGIIINATNALHDLVIQNSIYGKNQNRGITVRKGNSLTIKLNTITKNNIYGVYLTNSVNSYLSNNIICSNNYGIGLNNCTNIIKLNSIFSNITGIQIIAGLGNQIIYNNFNNKKWNYQQTPNGATKYTNDWWGSTVASTIASKISNYTGYSNFTIYRLFGAFNIIPGADITPPNRVNNFTAKLSNGFMVNLQWNQSTAGDFARYSIYRSPLPGTTNLYRNF